MSAVSFGHSQLHSICEGDDLASLSLPSFPILSTNLLDSSLLQEGRTLLS